MKNLFKNNIFCGLLAFLGFCLTGIDLKLTFLGILMMIPLMFNQMREVAAENNLTFTFKNIIAIQLLLLKKMS